MSELEASETPESFPNILETGSMLKLVTELVEDVPTRLGPYRILERIGEGGMGVVYLAEQDPPLVRRVAIKLARSAVPGDRALARFESERQTLAVLSHQNIARVFDAGTASDARPFFVMEYVAGESITHFCDSRQFGIEARLELFLRVCDGVQHAHLNAVIHRDLKPPNILVTSEGGRPTPKIIDFGVAKALGNAAGPTDGLTQFGQLVGTPEYMSPEQAALDGRSVDSRTDVYSLGVVLYELLVGGRPFEREAGPDASFVDLCRRIREQEPERPSVRALSGSSEAAGRRLQPGAQALGRRLRGDLDAIVVKALAKDPRSRYASPSELAADIERHLGHLPIQARTPGPLVRMSKAFRRHRAAATVVTVLSATLIGLTILGTAQALRAQRESARAEAESRIGSEVKKFILGVIDPPVPVGTYGGSPALLTSSYRDALLDRIRIQFADQPILQSQLLFAVGNQPIVNDGSWRGMGAVLQSRDRISALLGPDSAEALAASESLGRTFANTGRFPEAERLLLDALERRRRLAGADHPDTCRAMANLAALYKRWDRDEEAAPLFEAAIAGLERRLGPDDPDVLSTKVGLSGSYLELHRYTEAQVLLERAIDPIRRVFGERDFQTMVALYNLACAHANSGRIDLAFDYLRRTTDIGFGYPGGPMRDPQLLPLHGDARLGRLDRAARLNEPSFWPGLLNNAKLEIQADRTAAAERLLRDLVAAVDRSDPTGERGWTVPLRFELAWCWILEGRFDDAERLLSSILAAARATSNYSDENRALALLAQVDIGRGHKESALAKLTTLRPRRQVVFERVERAYADAEIQALQGRADDAMRSLAHASELGLDNFEQLEHDLAFVELRGRAEFVRIAKAARRRAL